MMNQNLAHVPDQLAEHLQTCLEIRAGGIDLSDTQLLVRYGDSFGTDYLYYTITREEAREIWTYLRASCRLPLQALSARDEGRCQFTIETPMGMATISVEIEFHCSSVDGNLAVLFIRE